MLLQPSLPVTNKNQSIHISQFKRNTKTNKRFLPPRTYLNLTKYYNAPIHKTKRRKSIYLLPLLSSSYLAPLCPFTLSPPPTPYSHPQFLFSHIPTSHLSVHHDKTKQTTPAAPFPLNQNILLQNQPRDDDSSKIKVKVPDLTYMGFGFIKHTFRVREACKVRYLTSF